MSGDMPIRHVVSIAGVVQEKNDRKASAHCQTRWFGSLSTRRPRNFNPWSRSCLTRVRKFIHIDATDFVTAA